MSLDTSDNVVTSLPLQYAGVVMRRVYIRDGQSCEVGRLPRSIPDDDRLLLRAIPGQFCMIVPLVAGDIINAWCDRCPEPLEGERNVLHAFDLRYAWSLQRDFPHGALIFKVSCEAMPGWWGTERQGANGSTWHEPAVRAIVSELCQAVAELLGCKGFALDNVGEHLVQAILGNVRMGLCECVMHPRPSKDRFAGWQEQRVRTYIAANLNNKIRLADVSRNCGMSCSHFSRLFKNTIGVTLHKWILEQRVIEAKRLLRDTSTAIAEIAAATGFADQAHFSRVFARTTRTTPMAWRRVSQA